MRPKTSLGVVLVLALVGATAFAWHQYQELVLLRARLVAGEDRAALESQLADLKRRNQQLEFQLAASRHNSDGTDPAAREKKPEGREAAAAAAVLAGLADDAHGVGGSRKDAEMELLAALADMPEFQSLIALQQRGKIDAKYASLFRKLNLSPEQQQQLETLLADKQSAFADAMIAAHDQGLSGKDAREMAQTVARATQKQIDDSIKSMLGPQGYNQYQNYERTLPQRETVEQLAQRLSYTSAPLTPKQQDQLVQTLASAAQQQRLAAKAAAATGGSVVRTPTTVPPLPNALSGLGISSSTSAIIPPTALGTAQTFLNPQQMSALKQMQQEQLAQQTLGQLLRRGLNGTPAKPGKG